MIETEVVHVYAILVDRERQKVGLNLRDGLLPPKATPLGKLVSPFGAASTPNEAPRITLSRIIRMMGEYGQQFSVDQAELCYYNLEIGVVAYALPTQFHDAPMRSDKDLRLTEACRQGDGIIRTFGSIEYMDDELFAPGIKPAILAAILI